MGLPVGNPQDRPHFRRAHCSGCGEAWADRWSSYRNAGRRGFRTLDAVAIPPPEGTACCRSVAEDPGADPRRPGLCCQRPVDARPAQSTAAACRVPESRVLQGPGYATAHVWQAAHHRLCRRPCRAYWPAARLPGGSAKPAGRPCVATPIRDERHAGTSLDVQFHGDLRPEQEIAARAMLAYDTGVLSATTAFGKTVVAAWLIAQRGVNTLVLVHRRQLLQQWVERLSAFLDLPPKRIGRIGGGQRKPTGALDVAVIQSLVRKGVVSDCVADMARSSLTNATIFRRKASSRLFAGPRRRFVLGLSATVARKDGHHPIIFMQCGPVRHQVDAKAQAAARPFQHAVLVRPTSFRPLAAANPDMRIQFQNLYGDLIADEQRNRTICDEVVQAVREGRSPLVLTERNEHLDRLAAQLTPRVRQPCRPSRRSAAQGHSGD